MMGHRVRQEHNGGRSSHPIISVFLHISPWGSPELSVTNFVGPMEKMTVTIFMTFVHHSSLIL